MIAMMAKRYVLVNWKLRLIYAVTVLIVHESESLRWQDIRCAVDPTQSLSDGYISDIGRFPWLGVVQHNFYLGGKVRYAITTGILIHPAYAIAPAEDIAKIEFQQLAASVMFARTRTDGFNAVLRKKVASLVRRVRGSSNSILKMVAEDPHGLVFGHFNRVMAAVENHSGGGHLIDLSSRNQTKLILWHSKEIKYAIDIKDYVLHPEYEQKVTFATIAILQLNTYGETGVGDNPKPVLPVCLPTGGLETLTDLYAVRMTDVRGDLEKEAFSMDFVDNRDCDEYYYNHGLTYKMQTPVSPTCAKTEQAMEPCVWDAGAALITRQSWGHWKLLGFSTRGPGCGAPSRFLSLYDYMPWINDIATPLPIEEITHLHRIGLRRVSPIKIILYSADKIIPKEQGQCSRRKRGSVVFKDAFEITATKNFGQGFFFVVINQIAEFTCAIVNMQEVTAKSNAAMWIEHYCHRDMLGTPPQQPRKRDYKRNECFLYFKSAVFLEFRFYFSFKAIVESTIYGISENPRRIPNPFMTDETTEAWWPTVSLLAWDTFVLQNKHILD